MSKLPQLNLRIPTEYQDLVRQVAQRLRERDAADFARDLTYWLNDMPEPGKIQPADLDGILARLVELENWRQSFNDPEPLRDSPFAQPLGPTLAEVADAPRRLPDDVLEEAHRLRALSYSWQSVAQQVGLGAGSGDALRHQVARYLKRKAKAA